MRRKSAFPWMDFIKRIAVIAIPVALQNLLTTTGSMVDTMMIAPLGEGKYRWQQENQCDGGGDHRQQAAAKQQPRMQRLAAAQIPPAQDIGGGKELFHSSTSFPK